MKHHIRNTICFASLVLLFCFGFSGAHNSWAYANTARNKLESTSPKLLLSADETQDETSATDRDKQTLDDDSSSGSSAAPKLDDGKIATEERASKTSLSEKVDAKDGADADANADKSDASDSGETSVVSEPSDVSNSSGANDAATPSETSLPQDSTHEPHELVEGEKSQEYEQTIEGEERQKLADTIAQVALGSQTEPALVEQAPGERIMWRLYNPNSGEHFYTSNMTEAKKTAAAGWNWEGIAWIAPASGDPVYRLYNPFAGDHHYTLSTGERDVLVGLGWMYEGIGWYSDPKHSLAVFRQYNPHAQSGAHNFTVNGNEVKMLKGAGWKDEGIGWYALKAQTSEKVGGFWLSGPNAKRAWVGKNGRVSLGCFTQAGDTYYAPDASGWVIQGRVDDGKGHVYLADSKGRLATKTGWLVTSAYGDGMQRYWMEKLSSGVVAAKSGHFTVSGEHYWGIANKGYVLRGKLKMGQGMLLADNSGKLAWKSGWLITSTYDGGTLERYYIDNSPGAGLHGAHIGSFSVGGKSYFGSEIHGYTLRNRLVTLGGVHYWADNDGVLTGLKNGKYGWQNPAGYYQVSPYNVVLPSYSRGIFSYVSPSQVQPDSTRADCVEIFVRRAQQYLGTPYVWDYACAPGVGVDCAGLVLQCLYSVGITPNKYTPYDHFYTPGHDHYAVDMRNDPKFMRVSFAERKRGDLIFYAGHVAIYVGGDVIINAVDSQVQYDSVYRWPILSVSRVFI